MRIYEDGTNLDKMIIEEPMLIVLFGADDCGVCYALKEKIDIYTKKHPIMSSIYVSIDKYPHVAVEEGVFSAPALIVYMMERVIIDKRGIFSMQEVTYSIDKYLTIFKDELKNYV